MMTKYAIRNMILNHKQGSIIHISSISAYCLQRFGKMYASSKGAQKLFSKIRQENGRKKRNPVPMW